MKMVECEETGKNQKREKTSGVVVKLVIRNKHAICELTFSEKLPYQLCNKNIKI